MKKNNWPKGMPQADIYYCTPGVAWHGFGVVTCEEEFPQALLPVEAFCEGLPNPQDEIPKDLFEIAWFTFSEYGG